MMGSTWRRRFGGVLSAVVILLAVCVVTPPGAACDPPRTLAFSLAGWEPEDEEPLPRIRLAGSDGPGSDGGEGSEDRRGHKIVGSSLLISGLLMCSWGIASWEVEEYQCCPANNTGNVVKIVAGVMLFNAGLIYLLVDGE